jgi:hypothetical protein
VPIGSRVDFDNEQPAARHLAQNVDAQECDISPRCRSGWVTPMSLSYANAK